MEIRIWKENNKAEMSLTKDEALRVIQSLIRQMRHSNPEDLLHEFLLVNNTEFRFCIVDKILDICGDCGCWLIECKCPVNGCYECGGNGVTCGCWQE